VLSAAAPGFQHSNVPANASLSLPGRSCAASWAKTCKNDYHHSQEGQPCFPQFTHTQLLHLSSGVNRGDLSVSPCPNLQDTDLKAHFLCRSGTWRKYLKTYYKPFDDGLKELFRCSLTQKAVRKRTPCNQFSNLNCFVSCITLATCELVVALLATDAVKWCVS